jgi:hypothetical protein
MRAMFPSDIDVLLDKTLLRTALNESGASKIRTGYELELIGGPIVAKPRQNGMGGLGVKKFESYGTARIEAPHGIANSPHVEEWIVGQELAVDAVWSGQEIHLVRTGWALFDGMGQVVGTLYGASSLTHLSDPIMQALQVFCKKTNLSPQWLNVDAIVDEVGDLHVIEIEFVPGDAVLLEQYLYNSSVASLFIGVHDDATAEQLDSSTGWCTTESLVVHARKGMDTSLLESAGLRPAGSDSWRTSNDRFYLGTWIGSAVKFDRALLTDASLFVGCRRQP